VIQLEIFFTFLPLPLGPLKALGPRKGRNSGCCGDLNTELASILRVRIAGICWV